MIGDDASAVTPRRARTIGALILAVIVAGKVDNLQAQSVSPDTIETVSPLRTHSPSGALWRAVALPGWGQVYNRQFIKLPILYAAIGGLAYLAFDINDEYLLYRRAFLYKSFQELVDAGTLMSNPNASLKPYYDELSSRFGPISSNPIRARRDNLRRNRDLSFVGVGLVYALSVLDAYISAHLLNFDIGEDLTVELRPVPEGFAAHLQLRF